MDNLNLEKENLEKQIQELQLRLTRVNEVLAKNTPRNNSIVFLRMWEDDGGHEVVHILHEAIRSGESIPVITSQGDIEYNFAEGESLVPREYTGITVLTREEAKEVFEFIKEIANR